VQQPGREHQQPAGLGDHRLVGAGLQATRHGDGEMWGIDRRHRSARIHELELAAQRRIVGDAAIIDVVDAGPVGAGMRMELVAVAAAVDVRPARTDLGLIRGIRNAFAHASEHITFKTKAVHDVVHSLDAARGFKFEGAMKQYPAHFERAKFTVAVASYCAIFDEHNAQWTPLPSPLAAQALSDALSGKQTQQHPPDRKSPSDIRKAPGRPPGSSQE